MKSAATEKPKPKRRLLFMAEAVTLAHVARPHVLANSLPSDQYEVLFACDPRYDPLFDDATYRRRAINSVPSEQFLAALDKGAPVYDLKTLQGYVEEDLAVIDEFRPDVIVSDFRLSLSVSARVSQIPLIGISNAYWSPHSRLRCPVPELPMTRWLGYPVAQTIFDLARPFAFALHARPINRLRHRHGLSSLGHDVRWAYTDADHVMFADWPELVPMKGTHPTQHFIGPILWSPAIELPDWWNRLDPELPIVYVTLGSSGDPTALSLVLRGLSSLPCTVIAATAGRCELETVPDNAHVAKYLPGEAVAKRASVVVCNGGSPTTHQALAVGTPVVGIPSNLDQCLNMRSIESYGAGILLRRRHLTDVQAGLAVEPLLGHCVYQEAAERLAKRPDAEAEFRNILLAL